MARDNNGLGDHGRRTILRTIATGTVIGAIGTQTAVATDRGKGPAGKGRATPSSRGRSRNDDAENRGEKDKQIKFRPTVARSKYKRAKRRARRGKGNQPDERHVTRIDGSAGDK